MPDDDVRIEDRPEQSRYELYVGGERAGIAEYRDAPGRRTFFHTEVGEAFGGRGLAGRLAARALDDARTQGLTVVPTCPFVRAYIERHPEYADLVHQW